MTEVKQSAERGQPTAEARGRIPRPRTSHRGWWMAVAATLIAGVISGALSHTLPTNSLLLIPLLAVIFSAYFGGLGPGLLTTLLSTVPAVLFYFHLPPDRREQHGSQIFAFLFFGCVFSVLCDRRGPAIARIEEERRRAEENADAARTAEQRLNLLLNGIKDYAIALIDPQGRITSWNAGGEQIQGWRADEIIGQSGSRLYRSEDQRLGVFQQALGTALSTGHYEEEGWLVRRDDTLFRAHTVVTPIFDAGERLQGFTLVAADITERVRAEEERGRLLAQVQQADLWQRTFLREVLFNVTEGRLRLCEDRGELPTALEDCGEPCPLDGTGALRIFRRRIEEIAEESGFSVERSQDLITGASEVAMNAIVHGGGGVARLCAEPGKMLQLWVEDHGEGMALGTLHRATLEKGYTTAGTMGYGWFLTLRTVDRVWLLTGPFGTAVVLEQEVTAPQIPLLGM